MFRSLRFAVPLIVMFIATQAVAGAKEDERARHAAQVLSEIQQIPETSIPDKLLDEAKAIVVIPDTIKAGLLVGGRRGHGLMSVKLADGTWSNPAFIKLTGGSIGFQAGVQSADIILAFLGDRSVDGLVNGRFTLGADAAVAAGPVGRNAAAATDGQFQSEIVSWSRARGLFAGIALDGAVLQIDDAANLAAYGPDTTPRMIFEGRATGHPSNDIVAFRDRLEEASYAAREMRRMRAARSTTAAAETAPATATPTQPAEPAAAESQGFQPVSENGIRTEQLDGNP
ncbi:MAG: lipid-binding SYLF domain-containing protein [Xanthomonadaceae bacterium]|jgi:lipid-binding SYLF domain-containing protein|nr:lipid-binding SYLF domain-containing protein [Xanthomonadaceae bacterium]